MLFLVCVCFPANGCLFIGHGVCVHPRPPVEGQQAVHRAGSSSTLGLPGRHQCSTPTAVQRLCVSGGHLMIRLA